LQSLLDANGISYDYGFLWLACKDLFLKPLESYAILPPQFQCDFELVAVLGVIAQLFGPIA